MRKTAKVNDPVDLGEAAGLVRLVRTPDGTVATCSGTYTPRAEGTYVFCDAAGEELAKVKVTPRGEA